MLLADVLGLPLVPWVLAEPIGKAALKLKGVIPGEKKKAKEAAAATNEARAARAAANGDAAAANAAVEEAQAVAAKIGIGRANGAFEMHSPLAAGRRLKPDAVVGRGG